MYMGFCTSPIAANTDDGGWEGLPPMSRPLRGRRGQRAIRLALPVARDQRAAEPHVPDAHAADLGGAHERGHLSPAAARVVATPTGRTTAVDGLLAFWDEVNREDIAIVERVQHGSRRPGVHGRSHVLPLRGVGAPLPEHGRRPHGRRPPRPGGRRDSVRPSRAPLRAPATASSTCSSSTMSGGASATPSLSERVRRPCLAGGEPQPSRCLRVACDAARARARPPPSGPTPPRTSATSSCATELGQPSVEARLELARPEDEVVGGEQVEVRERRGAARRVPRIGRAVRERDARRRPRTARRRSAPRSTPPSGR